MDSCINNSVHNSIAFCVAIANIFGYVAPGTFSPGTASLHGMFCQYKDLEPYCR
jgi:hypothetical protein